MNAWQYLLLTWLISPIPILMWFAWHDRHAAIRKDRARRQIEDRRQAAIGQYVITERGWAAWCAAHRDADTEARDA